MNPKQRKPSISPARRAAFEILRRVATEGSYASVLIASLPDTSLSREDRALAQEITLGVLRWQRALDYFIERYAARPVRRLDVQVVIALRMGLYQLRYLARVPSSAAVNESVNLVKESGVGSASGFVNAVLRKAAQNPDEEAGADIIDPIERGSIQVSHPAWMLQRWSAQLGEDEAQSLALANNSAPMTAFRVNTLRASPEEALAHLKAQGVTARSSEFVPGAFVAERGSQAVTRAAARGLIYVQDEASQLVSLLVDAQPGERVLDVCAAPGSKSSHLAALTRDESWIVSCDVHAHRLASVATTCKRLGVRSVDALALDATRELPFWESAPKFDRVLIDAPCSGTGTLRRNPEIKWRLSAGDIPRLAEVQLSLLEHAASSTRGGGRLVYSTCSLEAEENEGVIDRFLQSGAPFRVTTSRAPAGMLTAQGFIRTFPHRHGADGFFIALLEKL
ncbi:MAG TPA: 16S rRNA (cytosine(967)-C(5))-methyltransferase RsmB [Blastocatellia bacterium]|nr:16S rRNA (cytosine(967)-C(5))-methyltransferase RsmB [Blastocatellia bacterium]